MTTDQPEDAEAVAREVRLARHLVSLADTLVDDFDVSDLLERLVRSCVELTGGTSAGLMLLDARRELRVVASSSEETRLLELFQLQAEEGPCLDTVRSGAPVHVDDVTREAGRWPRFAQAADALGYRAVHAVPLRLRADVIGGLNLFSSSSQALSARDQEIARALADIATIGILQQRSLHRASLLAEQLQTALDSRVVIEQAKGVLAEHGQLSMDEAYRTLRAFARNSNRKLGAVAADVVAGQVPLAELTATDMR